MRILTLIENTSATEKLSIEHGLSLYIEHMGKKVLLDTGASAKFRKNAERMQISVRDLDCVVLSHNHIDHTGGLDAVFAECTDIRVFARENILCECYKKSGLFKVEIGEQPAKFERHRDNMILFNKFQEVTEGMYLLTDEVGDEEFFTKDKTLFIKKGARLQKDEFLHELFMVVFPTGAVEGGCVILSSCSHRGIVNIINTVRSNWQDVEILAVIGGFHLMGSSTKQLNCSPDFVEQMADEIAKLGVGVLYTCHCTGQKGYELLKEHLGDQVQYLQTGEELEF